MPDNTTLTPDIQRYLDAYPEGDLLQYSDLYDKDMEFLYAVRRCARAAASYVHRVHPTRPCTRREMTLSIPSRDRKAVYGHQWIDYAESQLWVVKDGEKYLPGPSRPA